MKSVLIIVFSSILFTSLKAQSLNDDFKKVLEQMTAPKNLYYDAIFLYFEEGMTTASDSMSGTYQRSGSREYFRLGQTERLEENGSVVIADHDEKVVAVGKPSEGEAFAGFDLNLWELMMESNGVVIEQESEWGEYRKLRLRTGDEPENLMKLTFSTRSFQVAEIEMMTTEFDESDENAAPKKNRVIARYFNYNTAAIKFPHRQSDFVLKKGNSYLPTGKCANYHLI